MATSTRRTTTTVRTASPFGVSQNQISESKLAEDLFAAYFSARKNKRSTFSQMKFESNLVENIISLRDEIMSGHYKPGRSMCFIIQDPVQREVFAASFRDRIVHHLLFNWINPVFERTFIDDSYSCRKGKGTLYGIQHLARAMRECSAGYSVPAYVLKLDIQGYFMSIDRILLYDMVLSRLEQAVYEKWPEAVNLDLVLAERLLAIVIFNDPTAGCRIKGSRSDWDGLPDSKSLFKALPGKGLPIGNLTSQLFSNVYLSALDNYVTEDLDFRYYGRYVDDFYLVCEDKSRLLDAIPKIRVFLSELLLLNLHPRKIYLQDVRKGCRFLGSVIRPESVRLCSRTRKHFDEIMGVVDIVPDPFARAAVRNSLRASFV